MRQGGSCKDGIRCQSATAKNVAAFIAHISLNIAQIARGLAVGTGFLGLSWPVLAACEFDASCGGILTRREPRPPSSGHCAGPGKCGTHMPRDRESGKTSQSSRIQLCRARSTSRNISELSRRQCDEDIKGSRFERCLAPSSQEQPRAAKLWLPSRHGFGRPRHATKKS